MTPATPLAQRVRDALDAAPTSATARRLLEIDAVDVARAYLALDEAARAVVLAEASLASCIIHGAPGDVMRTRRDEYQRAFGALRDLLAAKPCP